MRLLSSLSAGAIVVALAAVSVAAASAQTLGTPAPAQVVPYSQTFYGAARSDPYHWMEAGGTLLDGYIRTQSVYTRSLLRANPGRPKLLAALRDANYTAAAATTTNGVVRVGTRIVYLQSLPGSGSPSLLARAQGQRKATVVVNAASLPKDHVIGWFEPSPRGTKIAYGVTASSENVVIHVCNADGSGDVTQAIAADVIPDVTWHDERSFYYTLTRQLPTRRETESLLHVVGSSKGSDEPIAGFGANGQLGSGTNHDLYVTFSRLGTRAVFAQTYYGVSPYTSVFVAPFAGATRANAPWRRLFAPRDEIVAVAFAGDNVYALTDRGDARRSLIVRDWKTGAFVRTIAPHGAVYRMNVFANKSGVFVAERAGADVHLAQIDAAGTSLGNVALPTANVIDSFSGDAEESAFFVRTASFSDPGHWYEVVGRSAAVRDMHVSPPVPRIYSRLRATDAIAVSADGTNVPYTILYARGTPRDGRRPTIVVGYGAYGFDIEPPTPAFVAALTELGVVVALTHIRGGGEFGEPWHRAGKGPTKQHTIDDFVACAQAVLHSGWTAPGKLAGWGASAGGITIGGAITQHPELFAVAISEVGMSDMVDFENAPNGSGNVPEFGSVKTANGFRDLRAMSAYDHVIPAAYPATILTTGRTDVRVPSWEAAKMAARLQASTTSGKPVLLRADEQGHGVVRDVTAEIEEDADVFTFMLWQLGEPDYRTK